MDTSDEAMRGWFLGPRAENARVFEQLIVEALRDHVFWRRNHHPDDGVSIHPRDQRTAGYDEAMLRLSDELSGLLAALKRDVPFFSTRYQGHMVGEQTIAAQVGYFAAMLYNPNNVVSEVSPVTTRLELDAAAQLASMVGYDASTSWGHLTSGGTIANFEALWIARGVRYLPVALALAARDLGVSVPVRLPDGTAAAIERLDLWRLLNVQPVDVLDCWDRFCDVADPSTVRDALDQYSLAAIGYQDYTTRLATVFGDPLPAGVVLVSSTGHYSWEKVVRALGIGSRRLVSVPVDAHARIDIDALWSIITGCAARRTPIVACVGVLGTTEEGAMDKVDAIVAVRDRAARELGVTFHLHVDACFGGYACTVAREPGGKRAHGAAIRARLGGTWPSDEWTASVHAVSDADSISIDPHKLGYIPYPAGAFLLRDRRGRSLVSHEPPYLTPAADEAEAFLGRWILEGSKPGAAAAAVWLSHRVVPLDWTGYGAIIARTHQHAARLHARLTDDGIDPFVAITLPEPDLNIVNWVIRDPRSSGGLREINRLNQSVFEQLSPAADNPPYYISRTVLRSPQHDGIVNPLLGRLGVDEAQWRSEGLVMLRAVVMSPFAADGAALPDHVGGLLDALRCAASNFPAMVTID